MNVPRIVPAIQILGRTLACNRSDIFQQGIRLYSQNTNNLASHLNISGASLPNSNFDDRLRFQQNLLHTGRGSYLKIVSKSFSTGVQLFCREFKDGENEHAHDVLCSLPAYRATTINMKLNSVNYVNTFLPWSYQEKFWPAVGTDELVNTFMSVSKALFMCKSPTESQQYNNLFNCLIERIPYTTDDQLLAILSALCYWPQVLTQNSPKYNTIWKTLDNCCSHRIQRWSISQVYLVADHWYALRITKISIFFNTLVRDFGRIVSKLSPTQFVQYMFYANLNREIAVKNNVLNTKLNEVLKVISVEELGIVAMSLFKTKTSCTVYTNVVENIMKITEKHLDKISDHSLGSILKLLGRSLPSDGHQLCYNFLESLNSHLPRFNNYVHLKAVQLGNALLVFHESLFRQVAFRVANEISSLRLKDIERFSYNLMVYRYIPPECSNILSLIVDELRRPERIVEINHFPRAFSACVNYLVEMDLFPHDLISAALQPSMIQIFRDDVQDNEDKNYGRELLEIDRCISIELPSTYLGYKLNPDMRNLLTERFIGRIATLSMKGITHQERLSLDIQTKLSAMMGSDGNVELAIILPHFSHPDLIFCTTRDGEPVKIPDEFNDFSYTDLKPASKFDHLGLSWNAVMIGGRNSILHGSDELKGNLLMKKRQLAKLGYHVSVVPYTSYIKVGLKCKLQFLEKCLQHSTLNLEGRREAAFLRIRADAPQNGNTTKQEVESLDHQCDPKKEDVSFLAHG